MLALGSEPHVGALGAGPDAAPVLPRRVPAAVPAILEAAGIPEHAHLQHTQTRPLLPWLQARTPLQS